VLYATANQGNCLRECRAKGLLRPWLLLVSMHPERRMIIAGALNISVLDTYGFKPAEEAYEILLGANGICHHSIWQCTKYDISKPNEFMNPWMKILIREAGMWNGIECPDDILRLDKPANFNAARERSNRADDLSEPGRVERLLLNYQQERLITTRIEPNRWYHFPGSMEGLEILGAEEANVEVEFEARGLNHASICYEPGTGWINRHGKHWARLLVGNMFTSSALNCSMSATSEGAFSTQSHCVVSDILRQRVILSLAGVDFGRLVSDASRRS